MSAFLSHRLSHYLLLLGLAIGMYLPNLGDPSLWDIDEGNNAEAAREMFAADNWRVPTFNYQMRVDKPALLYWLQIFGYRAFGVSEFAARLPSALASIVTVLVTYELARLMFGTAAGLLAGVVLASTVMFCAAAHFANPDALLTMSITLISFFFWRGLQQHGRIPFFLVGAATGLAVLAKGPVGLALPFTVNCLYLFLSGQGRQLLTLRLLAGVGSFCVVALPWYIWVGVETKFEFLRRFIEIHNVGRFMRPMEGHGGPAYYYLATLLFGFAPWSIFLGPVCWYGVKEFAASSRSPSDAAPNADRFLFCWIFVYVAFFSVSRTKLPNYILPIYPAVAIVTARFLDRWRCGLTHVSNWVMYTSLSLFGLIGIGTAFGLSWAGDSIDGAGSRGHHSSSLGLGDWALVGIAPVLGTILAKWCLNRGWRGGMIGSFATASVLFIAPLAYWGAAMLDAHKAPRALARTIRSVQAERDVRVASFEYFQPSLVFYCEREVASINSDKEAVEFLGCPLQVFLVAPVSSWERLVGRIQWPHRTLGRFHDMYRRCDIVLVTNRP